MAKKEKIPKKVLTNKKLEKPFLVEFEGVDGSGKSTLIKAVNEKLKKKFDTEIVVEPSDDIRPITEVFTEQGKKSIDKRFKVANEVLFLADRIKHSFNLQNKLYLFDRYFLSTFAYQVQPANITFIVANEVQKILKKPDLVVYINVDPSVAASRSEFNIREIKALQNSYEMWLNFFSVDKIIIPADLSLEDKTKIVVDEILKRIK